MSIVKECYEILEWMESTLGTEHPMYLKMKMIKTTLQGVSSSISRVKKEKENASKPINEQGNNKRVL